MPVLAVSTYNKRQASTAMAEHFLKPHAAAFQAIDQPSRDAVMRWIRLDESGHWFWSPTTAGEPHRRFNLAGQAIWSWRPRRGRVLPFRGIFVVARLLLVYDRGPFPPRPRFVLRCGLPQCVNPAHWDPVLRPPLYHLLESSLGWRTHLIRTARPVNQALLLPTSVAGTVHIVQFPAGHVRQLFTTCGLVVYPANAVIQATGSFVTCKGGC